MYYAAMLEVHQRRLERTEARMAADLAILCNRMANAPLAYDPSRFLGMGDWGGRTFSSPMLDVLTGMAPPPNWGRGVPTMIGPSQIIQPPGTPMFWGPQIIAPPPARPSLLKRLGRAVAKPLIAGGALTLGAGLFLTAGPAVAIAGMAGVAAGATSLLLSR